MHVGKGYPMTFNAQRMARNRVQTGLPRRWRAYWFNVVEPLFQPLEGRDTASGLIEEAADAQSTYWEWQYDDPPDTVLRITHSLTEDLTPTPPNDILVDTYDFTLTSGGIVYGTNRRLLVPAGSLFIYIGDHPSVSMPLTWQNLHNPDDFETATLLFAAAPWSDSPEWTPYKTLP